MIDADGCTQGNEPYRWIHPVDELEPDIKPADELRDARLMTVRMLDDFAVKMHEALTRSNSAADALIVLYGISFAMGLSITNDHSMSGIAHQLQCERATISKVAVMWNNSHSLQPSFHQKT